jgi:hypothetical protein
MEKLSAGKVNPIKSTDKEQYNTQPKLKFRGWLLVDSNDHLNFNAIDFVTYSY